MSDPLASPVPVSGPDAEILRYLTQVVAIGQHKGAWDAAAVHRIAEAHLRHPHTLRRQLLNERAARGRAEAEAAALRDKVKTLQSSPWAPKVTKGPTRVVHLSARLARVLDQLVTGAGNETIAAELGLSMGTVGNAVGAVMQAIGAKTRAEVLALVYTKQVDVRMAAAGKRAA